MSEQITIHGHQGRLDLRIVGYERPESRDSDDANWLTSEATIKMGAFTGAFRCALTTLDIRTSYESLKKSIATVQGTAYFRTTEKDIDIEIRFDNRGSAVVRGTISPQASLEASLTFRLDTDQSYLLQTMQQLEATLRVFPAKQYHQPSL